MCDTTPVDTQPVLTRFNILNRSLQHFFFVDVLKVLDMLTCRCTCQKIGRKSRTFNSITCKDSAKQHLHQFQKKYCSFYHVIAIIGMNKINLFKRIFGPLSFFGLKILPFSPPY